MRKEFKVEGLENPNPNKYGGMCSREILGISKAAKEKDLDEGIDTIATTEAPAMVLDWERYQVVREILPMRYMEMPNNDKVPLLDSHTRGSVEKVKGSATNFRVESNQLIAKAIVSKSEPIIREKIKEGHIDSVSIGYRTDSAYTVEIPKGASVTVDGISYKNDFDDGVPLLVRTWWKVHELSLVPIGADEAAKFRSQDDQKFLLDKINELETEVKSLKREQPKPNTLTYHEARLMVVNKM